MKVIIAFIDPSLTEKIAEALAAISIVGVTATKAKEFDADIAHTTTKHNIESNATFQNEIQLEVITHDKRVDDAVELIKSIAIQYRLPVAKIIIKHLDDSVRIRDGSHGEDVL